MLFPEEPGAGHLCERRVHQTDHCADLLWQFLCC